MLPAPKGGSRGTPSGRRWCHRQCFNAARPEGRESALQLTGWELQQLPASMRLHPGSRRHLRHLASMLPAPKGGSRLPVPAWHPSAATASMLPAPKGGSRFFSARCCQGVCFASMLPAPKGGSRTRHTIPTNPAPDASMLPAPKGGSRVVLDDIDQEDDSLQCCPPRRAGVGRCNSINASNAKS